jgi:hypothetical protein
MKYFQHENRNSRFIYFPLFLLYLCFVKGLHFLFALYIAALSVYPCSDAETCVGEDPITTLLSIGGHHHAAGELDLCTPFCICACCATHAQVAPTAEIMVATIAHNTAVFTPYRENHSAGIAVSVWQPPKVLTV